MLVCRHQAFIPVGVRSIWDLVGQPSRHSEWWPEVIDVQGKQFGPGCSYCQVSQGSDGVTERTFLIERLDECKEVLVRCEDSGLHMRWLLTEAREGTFVDAEFGLDERRAAEADPDFDPVRGRQELRQWLRQSLDGLTGASRQGTPPESAASMATQPSERSRPA